MKAKLHGFSYPLAQGEESGISWEIAKTWGSSTG